MDRIRWHRVTTDGPGAELGLTILDAGTVRSTPGVAAETVAMLGRRFGRTEIEIFALLRRDGWSNGQVVVVAG